MYAFTVQLVLALTDKFYSDKIQRQNQGFRLIAFQQIRKHA